MNMMKSRVTLCIAALSTSALATSPVPTSATPPSTPTTLGSAAAPQLPTLAVEKSDLQPASGEKFDPSEIRQAFSELDALKKGGGSDQQIGEMAAALNAALQKASKKDPRGVLELLKELQPAAGEKVESSEIREIRQALSELLALEEGVGSNQQIQEKKAALKAAVERGIKQDPKSVLKLLCGFAQVDNTVYGPNVTNEVRSFIQRDPELAIALLDQVPNEFGRSILAQGIGSEWAVSDLKAAFAWANQQTDSKIKNAILEGVIPSWAKTDLQGALAYAQSLPPGDSQDRTISKVFEKISARGDQGALAMMQSLPEGRIKDLAAKGISDFMSLDHPRAAWDLASGIADSRLRPNAEERVLIQLRMGSLTDPDAGTKWMQSLPEGKTKDNLSEAISWYMAKDYPQAAMDMASGIGDSSRRTAAQKYVVRRVSENDLAAATQWMQSLPAGRAKDLAASGICGAIFYADPQAAMDMASGIGDSDLRTEAQKTTAAKWLRKDPAAATQWIRSSSLPQQVKTQLLQR
jgi:hypothetical protein